MADREMTVAEAGRRGGEATAKKHGPEFYKRIGAMGGQKMRQILEAGKRAEAEDRARERQG